MTTKPQKYVLAADPGRSCEVGAMLDKDLTLHGYDMDDELRTVGFVPHQQSTSIDPKPLAPIIDQIAEAFPGTDRHVMTMTETDTYVDDGVTADQVTTLMFWPTIDYQIDMGDGTHAVLAVLAASVNAELTNGQTINRFDSAAWRWRLTDHQDDDYYTDGGWLYYPARKDLLHALSRWALPEQVDKTREAVRYGMGDR